MMVVNNSGGGRRSVMNRRSFFLNLERANRVELRRVLDEEDDKLNESGKSGHSTIFAMK